MRSQAENQPPLAWMPDYSGEFHRLDSLSKAQNLSFVSEDAICFWMVLGLLFW